MHPLHLFNNTVHGLLYTPENATHLVILCHGYKSSQHHHALTAIAQGLYKQGFAVFTFDFPKTKSNADLEHQVTTITRLVAHFNSDYEHISLLAASFGALGAATAAAELPTLTSFVTINGFFGSWHIGRKYFFAYLAFRSLSLVNRTHRRIQNYYASHFLPSHIHTPTLVIHSKVDKIVSIVQSRRFFQQLRGKKKFQALQTATHSLSSTSDIELVIAYSTNWLRQNH